MRGGYWQTRALRLAFGLLAVIVVGGCGASGGGSARIDGGANPCGGIALPTGFAFGALRPPDEEIERRPLAINPYAANPDVALPASVDLTAHLPPVGNQGQLGSCVAWAAGYAGATYTANRQYGWGARQPDHQASPGFLYNTVLSVDDVACGNGIGLATALDTLVQTGCSSMQTVAYSDMTCVDNPPATDAVNFRIGSFHRIAKADRDALRGELAAGRVVVIAAELYDDFLNFRGTNVYRGSGVYLKAGETNAAHAMAVVGYDDDLDAYRLMNSWTRGWGDCGFAWMAYETFETTVYAAYSLEPADAREPLESEPDSETIPEGLIKDAFQFVDDAPGVAEQLVFLVFYYEFTAPVLIRTVTLTDPFGQTSTPQEYNQWYADGYVYFAQPDGTPWAGGEYTLVFDTQLQNGADNLHWDTATIGALGDVGTGDGAMCYNYCLLAYDGVCDDGGPGSASNTCEYGTDCADCGPREEEKPNDHRRLDVAEMPTAGVRPGVLGANRRPLGVQNRGA